MKGHSTVSRPHQKSPKVTAPIDPNLSLKEASPEVNFGDGGTAASKKQTRNQQPKKMRLSKENTTHKKTLNSSEQNSPSFSSKAAPLMMIFNDGSAAMADRQIQNYQHNLMENYPRNPNL